MMDIEGTEWQLFRQEENLEWLKGVKLMSLEVRMLLSSFSSWFHPKRIAIRTR